MLNSSYKPRYSAGYEYRVGNTSYFIEKVQGKFYFERCSNFVGYLCSRCDVFDSNHGVESSVSLGIGLRSGRSSESS